MLDLKSAPFPITWRELWLPELINNNASLPSAISGGLPLTLSGARKGSTADGVHFSGEATSNIVVAANAIQNAKAAFHITLRFKLDQAFAAGAAADFYLFQKLLAADDYLRVYLKAADGKLYWEQGNLAAGIQFTLTSTTASWTAGSWYIITVSLTDTPTQRLLVDGAVEDTDIQAAVATPNGGDMVIGSSSDGGVDGVVGTISWVVIGVGATAAVALTTAEETELYAGVAPPTAKVQYMYLMNEGRGVTATDRGSSGGDGTLDSACTWEFGLAKVPVLSFDGINDTTASAASADLSGDLTFVVVIKARSTYNALSARHFLLNLWRANNQVNQVLLEYRPPAGGDYWVWGANRNSGTSEINFVYTPAIGDYFIFVGVISGTTAALYLNGSLVGTSVSVGPAPAGGAIANVGNEQANTLQDVSSNLMAGVIEGAWTEAQVKAFSRWVNKKMNLGLTI